MGGGPFWGGVGREPAAGRLGAVGEAGGDGGGSGGPPMEGRLGSVVENPQPSAGPGGRPPVLGGVRWMWRVWRQRGPGGPPWVVPWIDGGGALVHNPVVEVLAG